jgi:ATP-binding cassette subfamily A (ABC1) protein 3
MFILEFSLTGVGLRWDNFYQPVNAEDGFTMAHVFLMLVIDCIVYAMITWYVDAVYPGDFGIPKPLYFPFMVRLCKEELRRFYF